ncbi:MAG: hypothetical protein QM754_08715 [Tepidisphaeraceae bacterium]
MERGRSLVLRRGPYVIAGGLEEKVEGAQPFTLKGKFIPLFDANLPVISEYSVTPGARAVLVDVDAMPAVSVVAAACRNSTPKITTGSIAFSVDGIDNTPGVVCVKIPANPKSVTIDGKDVADDARSFADGVLKIKFTNRVEPKQIAVAW